MDELSRSARTLIDRAGPYDDPTGDDEQRVRQAVLIKVGAIGLGSAALAAGGPAQAKTAAAALLPKIGATIALLIGGAGAVAYVARSPEPAPNAPVTAPLSAPAQPAILPAPARAEPTEPEAAPALLESAPKARRPERAQPKPAAPVVETPEPQAASVDAANLADEMRLIRSADAALRAGRNGEALGLLAEHERDHQKGTLSQEREGLRLIARCQSGSGIGDAQRFLAYAPKSPLASRVKTACGLAK